MRGWDGTGCTLTDPLATLGPDDPALPRLLFVANPVLGWRTYSRRLIEVLGRRGDLRTVVLWHRPDRLSARVLRHHGGGRPLGIDTILTHRLWLGRGIRRAVRGLAPDLVHFAGHWPAGSIAAMPGAPGFTMALDATRQNTDAERATPAWTARELAREGALCRAARHLFPMSRWAAESLVADQGVAPERITVAPPAVDRAAFRPPEAHAGPPNVVFIGNDFARKGGARLCAWVEGPLAGACHLHIVSADPAARVRGRHITVHGAVPQAELFGRILPQMDLICLPTRLDMSPNVLAEAAAAGLPAVASRIGGIGELVIDGQTGLLAPAGDDDAFVAALRRLLDSADLRARMRAAAQAHAAAHLDAGRVFGAVADRLAALARGEGRER